MNYNLNDLGMLLEDFDSDEFKDKAIKEFLTVKKPEGTFKDMFDCLSKDNQNDLFSNYCLRGNNKTVKSLTDKVLEKAHECFLEMNSTQLYIFNGIEEKGYSDKLELDILNQGIIFIYEENGLKVTAPTEIIKLFKKDVSLKKKKEIEKNSIEEIITLLSLVYGFLSLDILKYYLDDFYCIKISEKNLIKFIKENYGKEYLFEYNNKEYYVDSSLERPDDLSFLKDLNPVILTLGKLESYYIKWINFFSSLSMVSPKIGEVSTMSLMFKLLLKPDSINTLTDDLTKEFKLTKKENKKLVEILNLFYKELRYFSLGGRTEKEVFALNFVLKEKPIKDTLDSYLQCLPKDAYEKLLYFNGVKDLDKLKDEIEDSFKEAIYEYFYNYSDVLIVLKKKDKKYKSDINLQLVLNGYLYLYEKDKELYIGIPKEIENIMKKIEPDDMRWRKLKSFDILDDNDWLPFN